MHSLNVKSDKNIKENKCGNKSDVIDYVNFDQYIVVKRLDFETWDL